MVVVTGASGHVGGNLVRALLASGRAVRVCVREDTRSIDGLDVERVRADVLDRDSLARAFDGAEVVYHLAALISIVGPQGGRVHRTNVEGPANVVEACLDRKVRRLVHFSSVHAFNQQPPDQPLDETREDALGRAPAYDRSKAAGHRNVLAGVARGLDAVIVHPTGIIGPHDYKPSRMGHVLLGLYRREFPALIAGGFDWVDVRDVVAGAMAAEQKGRTGERYLLSGHWVSVMDIGRTVERVTGVRSPRRASPMWLARVGAPFVEAWSKVTKTEPLYTAESLVALRGARDVRHDKAGRELGYDPRPFEDTIRDTFAWYKEIGWV